MRFFRVWLAVLLVSGVLAFALNEALVNTASPAPAAVVRTPEPQWTWVRIEQDSSDGIIKGTTCRTNPDRVSTDVVIVRPDEFESVTARLCLNPTD